MLLNTGEDASSESGERCGLLRAVESLVANVFLPTIETQNVAEPQAGSVKAELVSSLSSFVHALTSMSMQLLICTTTDCM